MASHRRALIFLVGVAGLAIAFSRAGAVEQRKITYNRDVRPILSDNCFYCHGPDKNHRDGKFRLDVRDSALAKGAIVPGKISASKLVDRIFSSDPDDVMPPPKTHKSLTAAQKNTLKQWVAQGAEYEPFWAYVVPKRPPIPQVVDGKWVRNPIDAFVLHNLEASHLKPTPEADKRTLLRRLSLDLIGLPPTPQEMQAFLDDKSADAYDKQVDRLLASPHYGERMAVPWLDAVRFADTVGFHGDQNQNVFPYRDYVIDAFNRNKPFNQFTVEQLAGDLLPHPTTEQLVATCFNRLNMMTREGGAQPKEYLAKYAADRVRTVSAAWLGSTMGCCECHDHKFDPFTTKDFYSMEAFWADVKQWGVYMDYQYTPNPDLKGFSNDSPFPPEIVVDSPYLHARLNKLTGEIDKTASDYATSHSSPPAAWREAVMSFVADHPTGWSPLRPEHPMEDDPLATDGKTLAKSEFALAPGGIAAIRIEILPDPKTHSIVRGGGRNSDMVSFSTTLKSSGRSTRLTIFHGDADHKQGRYSNGYTILGVASGWKLDEKHVDEAQSAVYLLANPINAGPVDHLVISVGKAAVSRVRVSVSPIASINPIDTAECEPFKARSAENQTLLARTFVLSAPQIDPATLADIRKLERDIYECRGGKSPVMVTQAVAPRPMRVLRRGNWQDEGGDPVVPATPAFLTNVSEEPHRRLNRLDLARWIVSPENPLTSRAVVNRLWKQFFGTGICPTVEDMGAQGEMPTNPELLDWLAVEFRDPSTVSGQVHGWNVKHIVKLMVMSSTYRQGSDPSVENREGDPGDRLFSYAIPRRLEAEFVRDNALAVAGLIDLDIGGPSCFPYQPAGYYANIQFPSRDYVSDTDERQYRRGVYMHWQRTFLHPMLANFDAPSREDAICTRNISNTPQQALTLLNDPEFVEAARVLAAKAIVTTTQDDGRLDFIFQRALCRSPKTNERQSLLSFIAQQRDYYESHKDDAAKLVHTENAPVPKNLSESDLAAWATVCRVVLNLHETITRY